MPWWNNLYLSIVDFHLASCESEGFREGWFIAGLDATNDWTTPPASMEND
jgi:hypothetical protein